MISARIAGEKALARRFEGNPVIAWWYNPKFGRYLSCRIAFASTEADGMAGIHVHRLSPRWDEHDEKIQGPCMLRADFWRQCIDELAMPIAYGPTGAQWLNALEICSACMSIAEPDEPEAAEDLVVMGMGYDQQMLAVGGEHSMRWESLLALPKTSRSWSIRKECPKCQRWNRSDRNRDLQWQQRADERVVGWLDERLELERLERKAELDRYMEALAAEETRRMQVYEEECRQRAEARKRKNHLRRLRSQPLRAKQLKPLANMGKIQKLCKLLNNQ